MSQRDNDPASNSSGNRHFSEVLEVSMQRRRVLQGGLGAAVLSFFGAPALVRMSEALAQTLPTTPTFTPVAANFLDTVTVPAGYSVKPLFKWGEPVGIRGNMPAFRSANGKSLNSPAEQAVQAGMDHDGMHYFPLGNSDDDDDRRDRAANRGLMCINHENIQEDFLFGPNLTPAEIAAKGKASHGVSVIEVRQDGRSGEWEVVRPSRYARRITGDTPMRIRGPAARHSLMQTAADPLGREVLGTLNNCANGATPWGTYLTCEENFNGYFANAGAANLTADQKKLLNRYGIPTGASGFNWYLFDERFDASKHPNESNRFGWVVEIDPKNPNKAPVKRTALGRFKHENAALVLAKDRRVVVYMGDDERNEYIYKFVSDAKFEGDDDSGNDLLDRGTLYVALFEPGTTAGDARGTGRWIPLVFGENGLTPANGFADQGDVLVKTRMAADRVGATMMDRPEWIATHPVTHEVYVTLTNNNRRGGTTVNAADGSTTAGSARPPADEANPRGNNVYGHIVRWREAGDDPAALTFEWDVYLFAGDPANPANISPAVAATTNVVGYPGFEDPAYTIFSAPDGLAFDALGWLWIQTDYGSNPAPGNVQANMGNCHMMLADIPTGRVGRFLVGPNGCEITGWTMTPDQKSLFINIQHPGEARASTWPDDGTPPRSATVVITKNDGGIIGT